MTKELQNILQKAKENNLNEARVLMQTYLKTHYQEEKAWIVAFQIFSKKDNRIYCLKRILAINPQNTKAAEYLAEMTAIVTTTGGKEVERVESPTDTRQIMRTISVTTDTSSTVREHPNSTNELIQPVSTKKLDTQIKKNPSKKPIIKQLKKFPDKTDKAPITVNTNKLTSLSKALGNLDFGRKVVQKK